MKVICQTENDIKNNLLISVTLSEAYGHAEVKENYSNDTPTCDDNAHKSVLHSHRNFL